MSTNMRILFLHQNLPGQFGHLLWHLLEQGEHEIVGLCESRRLSANRIRFPPKLRAFGYSFGGATTGHRSPEVALQDALRRGSAVAEALLQLKRSGFSPDVVYGHAGWGEMLFVRDVFPRSKVVNYCEYFFNREGQDFGFDPEFGPPSASSFLVGVENLVQTQSMVNSGVGISPTQWQRSRYPETLQPWIHCIHDGIDTERYRPDADAKFDIPGTQICLSGSDEVITYAARSLEPYRGFHIFMRAIPEILERRPNARVLVAGSEGRSYSQATVSDGLKERLVREIGEEYFKDRVYFTGPLSAECYLQMLQISTAHVYLTYPFVLSWSMLEAMSTGCIVVGSDTAPVREVIADSVNGYLVDFFSATLLADAVCGVCDLGETAASIRLEARETVMRSFDLRRVCLPSQLRVLME